MDPEGSRRQLARVKDLDPIRAGDADARSSPRTGSIVWVAWWQRDFVLFELGRYDEAVEAARRALALSGGYVDVNSDLIVMLAAAGHRAEAEDIFRRMEAPDQRPRWRPAFRALALAGLGRHAEALAAIEEAVRVRDGFITEQLDHRVFVPLHDDPRFMRIVKELGQERRVDRLKRRLSLDRSGEPTPTEQSEPSKRS
jgi:tetratricopeptide (TPR) repeat protein